MSFRLILCASLLLAACGRNVSNGNATVCPSDVQIAHPEGALHGQPCESASDCLYGVCHTSPTIAGFSFCTKACDCGINSECVNENGGGWSFVCQRFSPTQLNETMRAFCTQECTSVADCPPDYDDCQVVTGDRRICVQWADAKEAETLD